MAILDKDNLAQWALQQFGRASGKQAGGGRTNPQIVKPSQMQKQPVSQFTDTGTGDRFYNQGSHPLPASSPSAVSPAGESPREWEPSPAEFMSMYTEDYLEPQLYRQRHGWQKSNEIQRRLLEIGNEKARVALPKAEIAAKKMQNAWTNLGIGELQKEYQRDQSAVRPYARVLDKAEEDLRAAQEAMQRAAERQDEAAYRAAYLQAEQAYATYQKAREYYEPAAEKYSQSNEKYWNAYNVFEKARDNYMNNFGDFSRPAAMAQTAAANLEQNGQQYEVPEDLIGYFTELYKTGKINYETFANAIWEAKDNPSQTWKRWVESRSR